MGAQQASRVAWSLRDGYRALVPVRLFTFVQMELPWELGPADGRYLLRKAEGPEANEPEHVVVLATIGAERRGMLGKRSRTRLAPEYVERYRHEILDRAGLDELLEALPAAGIGALMCVERDAAACHRSLIAERLIADYGFEVIDLLP